MPAVVLSKRPRGYRERSDCWDTFLVAVLGEVPEPEKCLRARSVAPFARAGFSRSPIFLALFLFLTGILGEHYWRGAARRFYCMIAWTLPWATRRSHRVADLSRLAIPLIDMPMREYTAQGFPTLRNLRLGRCGGRWHPGWQVPC